MRKSELPDNNFSMYDVGQCIHQHVSGNAVLCVIPPGGLLSKKSLKLK